MSQTAITLAFEQWKASQAVTGEPVLLDEFVFANVPGLNTDKAIDRNEGLPPAAQIVHRQAVSRKGVVNENAVVHSVVLGADVGDFSFNWVGLINKASNTLAMIVHAPLQQKLKTKDGQQGNVLTRSFLMEYNGAQTETGINTPAETWQIDFTARMAGMDERQRLENIDLYGAAAFLGDGWLVAKSGTQFYVTAGAGYVRGLRALLAANQNITVTTKPVKVWLDVAWTGTLTSAWAVSTKITVAASLADYVQNGVQHYVFAVASIDANGNITDLRPKGTLNDQAASDALAKHEQSRNHPDGSLTAKGFVQLSSSVISDSETLAATPKAVKAAYDLANGKYTAQDATTAQKGIVQLSSATDSTSEMLAATPKAVKLVNDGLEAVKKTLGNASGKDVVTSTADTTDGRVLTVGWMGLGSVAGLTVADANTPNYNCFFKMGAEGIHGPVANAPSNILQFQYDKNAAQQIGYRAGVVNAAMCHRSKVNAVWGDWIQVFDTAHPPTAKQVGALPYSGGLLSSIYDLTATDVLTALGAGASSPTVGMPANSGNTRFTVYATQIYDGQFWVMLVSRDQNYTGQVNTTNKTVNWQQFYNTANKPAAADVDAVSASQGGTFAKEVAFSGGVKIRNSTGVYQGEDAAGFVSNNMLLKSWYGIGFYCTLTDGEGLTGYINTRNGQLEMKGQIIPGNYGNFDGRFYTKTLADQTFQPKGSYGKPNTYGISGNVMWWKCGDTGVIRISGVTANVSNSGRVAFPLTFPNKCFSVVANRNHESGDSAAMQPYSIDTTGFNLRIAGGGTATITWIAEGR